MFNRLALFADPDGGNVHVGEATLSRKLGFSRAKTFRVLDELQQFGCLLNESHDVDGIRREILSRHGTKERRLLFHRLEVSQAHVDADAEFNGFDPLSQLERETLRRYIENETPSKQEVSDSQQGVSYSNQGVSDSQADSENRREYETQPSSITVHKTDHPTGELVGRLEKLFSERQHLSLGCSQSERCTLSEMISGKAEPVVREAFLDWMYERPQGFVGLKHPAAALLKEFPVYLEAAEEKARQREAQEKFMTEELKRLKRESDELLEQRRRDMEDGERQARELGLID